MHSHALVVKHRPERASYLDQILLRPQHGADVFVRGGRLVTKLSCDTEVVPNSHHLPAELPLRDPCASLCPAQCATGAVGTRTERGLVTASPNPQVTTTVAFTRYVVVVRLLVKLF